MYFSSESWCSFQSEIQYALLIEDAFSKLYSVSSFIMVTSPTPFLPTFILCLFSSTTLSIFHFQSHFVQLFCTLIYCFVVFVFFFFFYFYLLSYIFRFYLFIFPLLSHFLNSFGVHFRRLPKSWYIKCWFRAWRAIPNRFARRLWHSAWQIIKVGYLSVCILRKVCTID